MTQKSFVLLIPELIIKKKCSNDQAKKIWKSTQKKINFETVVLNTGISQSELSDPL